jgi:hypothetical protein
MRSRRVRAERSLRTARSRRTTGTILIALGVVAWPIAALLLPPFERSLGIIAGGALVAGGITLITIFV